MGSADLFIYEGSENDILFWNMESLELYWITGTKEILVIDSTYRII